MKVVVIGGTGLIGSQLINKLKAEGHEAITASPSTGINTLTGEGLDHALNGADVVVDVANSPSFEDKAVLKFFETSGQNLLKAEQVAGIRHHIALSVVGTDLLTDSGYFRAKLVQENLIKASKIPYTIVRATQFFEFLNSIIDGATTEQTVHVPSAFIQPIASQDVAEILSNIVSKPARNSIIDIAGPERYSFLEIAKKYLKEIKDPRQVTCETEARYFGSKLDPTTLVPQKEARLGTHDFESWIRQTEKVS